MAFARGLRWRLVGHDPGLGGAGRPGVTVFTVAVVAGQVSGSLFVDRAGLGPAGHMPLSIRRVLAAGLALLAVAVAGWNQPAATSPGWRSWP